MDKYGGIEMNLGPGKKGIMLLVAVAALVPFGWKPAQSIVYRPMVEQKLLSLVEMSGAQPVEVNVQGWTRVNKKFISLEELEKLACKSAKRLGENSPQLMSEEGSDFRQVRIQSVLEEGSVLNLTAQSLINYNQPDRKGETYVTVNIVQKVEGKKAAFWSYPVEAALTLSLSGKPQVLTNMVAARGGKMSAQAQEKMLGELFGAVEAQKVDGINTEQLYSVTGFTPSIKERLEIGDKQVNLNIAFRYHNDDGHTYIYIGSPLLIGEY